MGVFLMQAMKQLDTKGNGHVAREDFMRNATQTFFSSLLEEMTNEVRDCMLSALTQSSMPRKLTDLSERSVARPSQPKMFSCSRNGPVIFV